jgi:hypothetical protein
VEAPDALYLEITSQLHRISAARRQLKRFPKVDARAGRTENGAAERGRSGGGGRLACPEAVTARRSVGRLKCPRMFLGCWTLLRTGWRA